MTPETPPSALLGSGGVWFLGGYLVALIGLGLVGRWARVENSLDDHYLAGRGMGLGILFLTLYATQYSGNTLFGFAGLSYRVGYESLSLVMLMMVIVGAYLVYVPTLYRRSRSKDYITVGDYVQDRFASTGLTVMIVSSCIVALANYVLTNMKAIGYLVETSTGGRISFAQGVIGLAIVMVVYETLGGLRSVAWSDALQGVLLFVGCAVIFAAVEYQYSGLSATMDELARLRPDHLAPPDFAGKRRWLSTMMIGAFGAAVYPQAIQRVFAARDERTLRRSLQLMVFMPLVTTLFIVVIGVVGAAEVPGLSSQGSDEIVLHLLNRLAATAPSISFFLILFVSAAIAAIMSTVDSALLALGSLFTQDLYRRVQPGVSQAHLTRVGKIFSWLIMAGMVVLALELPETIWRLIEIKLGLLCQVAPALFLGLHLPSLRARSVSWGFVAGTSLTLLLLVGHAALPPIPAQPWNVHAGIWGLGLNVTVLALVALGERAPRRAWSRG